MPDSPGASKTGRFDNFRVLPRSYTADVQPISAGWRVWVNIDHEGSNPRSANRPVAGRKASVIKLTSTASIRTKELVGKRKLSLIGGEQAPVPSYGHCSLCASVLGEIESIDEYLLAKARGNRPFRLEWWSRAYEGMQSDWPAGWCCVNDSSRRLVEVLSQ